jgi:hypothetical protein
MEANWGVEVYLHVFLTSALDGSQWSASSPGRFTPREITLVSIGYEAGWATEPVWTREWGEKFPAPSGIEPPIIQPVAQRYTDWATPAPQFRINLSNFELLLRIFLSPELTSYDNYVQMYVCMYALYTHMRAQVFQREL